MLRLKLYQECHCQLCIKEVVRYMLVFFKKEDPLGHLGAVG